MFVFSLSGTFELQSVAFWGGAFIALTLTSKGDELLVGDAIRSIILLKFFKGALSEVARDYNSHYITAAQSLSSGKSEEQEFIAATTSLNLFAVIKENATTHRSMVDEYSFGNRGGWHLGEIVSGFYPGESFPFLE